MEQRYLTLQIAGFTGLGDKKLHHPLMFAILAWLIFKIESEMQDELGDAKMELGKAYGKFGGGPWPAIGLVSDSMRYFDARYKLIEETCVRLLKELSVANLIKFLDESEEDWDQITTKIMDNS